MKHLQKAFCTIAFEEMHARQENAIHAAHRLVDHLTADDQHLKRAIHGKLIHPKDALACRNADEALPREIGMPFLACPLQRIFQPRLEAKFGIPLHTRILCDFIRREKTNALDVIDEAVWVFLYFRKAQFTICLIELHRLRDCNPKFLKRKHDVPHIALRGKGLRDLSRAQAADPRHLRQALRRVLEHRERIEAKRTHDLPRRALPYPSNQAAPQVVYKSRQRCRRKGAAAFCPKLAAIGRVFRPCAGNFDALAHICKRKRTYRRDLIPGLIDKFQHGKAVFLIAEYDVFYGTLDFFHWEAFRHLCAKLLYSTM